MYDHRYYHTKDETVWFMVSTVPSREPGVKNRYWIYSGASQLELACGRGKYEINYTQLFHATNYINKQIKILEQ
ncbi:MAG: hypothetical protein ABIJ40_06650 [Bacteroidota bacterium]